MVKGNEPAFPMLWDGKESMGLSKREYFAARAMQAFLGCDVEDEMPANQIANMSVVQADALLDALEPVAADPPQPAPATKPGDRTCARHGTEHINKDGHCAKCMAGN